MKKDVDYYDRLPWKVWIEPERQEDGTIIYIASHPEFEGVLGSGATPEEALADLHAASTPALAPAPPQLKCTKNWKALESCGLSDRA